jgi:hypothetical protein
VQALDGETHRRYKQSLGELQNIYMRALMPAQNAVRGIVNARQTFAVSEAPNLNSLYICFLCIN